MPLLSLRVLLLPALILLAFLVLPVGALILLTPPEALFSTIRDPEVAHALLTSAFAGALATLLGLLFGVPLAYLLARGVFPGKRLVEGLLQLPVVLPHSAAGLALLFFFGRRSFFGQAGMELTQSFLGVALAMTFVSVPYLVRAARDGFLAIDRRLEAVARTLGASPLETFRKISLPLAARGIASGVVLMWARGVSEFGAVVIVAYHPLTAPVLLFERFERHGLSAAQPLGALLVLLALSLLFLAEIVASHLPDHGEAAP